MQGVSVITGVRSMTVYQKGAFSSGVARVAWSF
jgi:hypothetical protein